MQVNLQRSQNWIMFFHSSVDVSLASWAEHYKQSPSSKGGGALKSSPSLYFFFHSILLFPGNMPHY